MGMVAVGLICIATAQEVLNFPIGPAHNADTWRSSSRLGVGCTTHIIIPVRAGQHQTADERAWAGVLEEAVPRVRAGQQRALHVHAGRHLGAEMGRQPALAVRGRPARFLGK